MVSNCDSVAWKRLKLRLKSWQTNVKRVWLATHLTTYGGKYSIERMLALDEYIAETPLWRVLFVILATPIPMALVVISQESVPLQDPAEGWRANYGFWVRVIVFDGAFWFGTAIHISKMIEAAILSTRQLVIFSTLVTALNVVGDMGLAAFWAFPVPFFTISHAFVVFLIALITFRVIVGDRVFREIAAQREQLIKFNNFVTISIFMGSVYPAFQAMFEAALDTKWEQPVILLLPFLKLLLKFVYRRILTDKDDFLPQGTTCSVLFFDAFYLATFMQRTISLKKLAVVMLVDVFETAFELRELHIRTNSILDRLTTTTKGGNTTLLDAVRSLCTRVEGSPETWAHFDIQLRSCIRSHKFTHSSTLLLEKLYKLQTVSGESNGSPSAELISNPKRKRPRFASLRTNEVRPLSAVIPFRAKSQNIDKRRPSDPNGSNIKILQETLEVLFTVECLVLAEYVETFIPIFYASFILVMVHLPSQKYHQEMEGVTSENVWNVVSTIFLYGLLEFLSFVVLGIIMQWKCGIRSLYHLSFVLETQTALIQSSLIAWSVLTLTYRVVHFGADFTFQFAWIN